MSYRALFAVLFAVGASIVVTWVFGDDGVVYDTMGERIVAVSIVAISAVLGAVVGSEFDWSKMEREANLPVIDYVEPVGGRELRRDVVRRWMLTNFQRDLKDETIDELFARLERAERERMCEKK